MTGVSFVAHGKITLKFMLIRWLRLEPLSLSASGCHRSPERPSDWQTGTSSPTCDLQGRECCRDWVRRDRKTTTNHVSDLGRGSPYPPLLPPAAELWYEITAPAGTLTATSWEVFSQRHSPKLYLQRWPTETEKRNVCVGWCHQTLQ